MSKKVPTRQLGKNGPFISAIGFGAGGFGDFYGEKTIPEEALKVLTYAADRGVTFWDCSDVYGDSEVILGKWFAQTGRRSEIFLATKFGLRDPEVASGPPISTPSHIRKSVARSLARLQTDHIDLYYQHRVDPNVPIEIVIQTLKEFIDNGQIKWIGLSECSSDVLRRAKAVPGVGDKIIAAQMEYSPFTLEIEDEFLGVARELGVAIVAYSPLGRGLISGQIKSRADLPPDDFRRLIPKFSDDYFHKNLELVAKFEEIAKKYGVTTAQVTIAWILAEHPDFFPIPGTRSIARVEENAGGGDFVLAPADVKAVRAVLDGVQAQGERYPLNVLSGCRIDCIPLSEWKGEQ